MKGSKCHTEWNKADMGFLNTTFSQLFMETIYSSLKAQNGKVSVRGEEEKG